jgi:tetratricopeptide (TPR) repeat protein
MLAAFAPFSCATTRLSDAELVEEYLAIGNEHFAAGRFERAILFYSRAAALDPTAKAPRLSLAKAKIEAKELEPAIELLRELDAQDKDNTVILSYLAYAYALLERYGDAEAAYRRVVALLPQDAGAAKNLAIILRRAGKPREAMEALRAASDASPSDNELRLSAGLAEEGQGMYAEAVARLEAYVAAGGKDGRALAALGRAYEALERYDLAAERLEAYLGSASDPEARWRLALIYLGPMAEAKKGLEALGKAAQEGFKDLESARALAAREDIAAKEQVLALLKEAKLIE